MQKISSRKSLFKEGICSVVIGQKLPLKYLLRKFLHSALSLLGIGIYATLHIEAGIPVFMQKLGKCNCRAPFLGLFALPVITISGLGICTLFPSKKRSTSQLPPDAIFFNY